jgi:hypothetical protein
MTVEQIAEICHEANREYCQALGDDSQKSWHYAPKWQKESAIAGVQFHLDNPNAGPQASHESWMAQKEADGWVFGEEKDGTAKTHPCMVPFDQLPKEQQAKDVLFRNTVHALAPLVEGYEDFGKVEVVASVDIDPAELENLEPGAVVAAADPLRVVLNNQNPPYIGVKRGDKMLLSARIELGSRIMVNGSTVDHRDFPHKDGNDLGALA